MLWTSGCVYYALRAHICLFHPSFSEVEEHILNVFIHIIHFRQIPWTSHFGQVLRGRREDAPKTRVAFALSERPGEFVRLWAFEPIRVFCTCQKSVRTAPAQSALFCPNSFREMFLTPFMKLFPWLKFSKITLTYEANVLHVA